MSVFPAIVPSSRTYDLGVHALDQRGDLSGAEVRFLRSIVATRHTLELTFDELTKQEAEKILAHYNAVRGSSIAFTIDAATWCSETFAEDYLWHYTATPTLEDKTANTFSCTLSFESVTSQTPRNSEGLPPAGISTGLVVTTAPIAPLVAQGIVIGQGHGAVTIASPGVLRIVDRKIQTIGSTVTINVPGEGFDYRRAYAGSAVVQFVNPGNTQQYFLEPTARGDLAYSFESEKYQIDIDLAPDEFGLAEPNYVADRHVSSHGVPDTIVGFQTGDQHFVSLDEIASYQSDPHLNSYLVPAVDFSEVQLTDFELAATPSYLSDPFENDTLAGESIALTPQPVEFDLAEISGIVSDPHIVTLLAGAPIAFALQPVNTTLAVSSYISDGHNTSYLTVGASTSIALTLAAVNYNLGDNTVRLADPHPTSLSVGESINFVVNTMTLEVGGEPTLSP